MSWITLDHSPRFDILDRCGLGKGWTTAHAQLIYPRGRVSGCGSIAAESANKDPTLPFFFTCNREWRLELTHELWALLLPRSGPTKT